MKTRLLCLFLLWSLCSNAQIVMSNLSHQVTSSTSANISFNIQCNGNPIYYIVQYSLNSLFSSPMYSVQTTMTDCNGAPLPKTVSISGLNQNTVYYFRVLASTNSNILSDATYSYTSNLSTSIAFNGVNHDITSPTSTNIIFDIQNNCTSVDYQIQYSTASNFASPMYSSIVTMNDCSLSFTEKTVSLTGLTLGTIYYYRVIARYGSSGAWVYSISNNFKAGNINIPQLNHQNVTATGADINYTIQNNCQMVYYKVEYSKFSNFSQSFMTDQLSNSNCVGNSFSQTTQLTNLTGGTEYYYRIMVSYSATGPWTLSPANNFTTLADPTGLIHEWKFNTSYMNESNSLAFTPTSPGTGFSTGRDGLVNGAVFTTIAGGGSVAVPNIPLNNQARTVSLWVNVFQYVNGNSNLFQYGSNVIGQTFALWFNKTGSTISLILRGYNDDVTYTLPSTTGTWRHIVASYDGTTAKLYVDGSLVASAPKSWSTVGNLTYFAGNYDGRIDDLKIYNRAVTDVEVSNLYYYNNVVVPTPLVPSIASITTTTMSNSATINYSLNANNASTTSIVRYGLTSGNLNNQITGFNANFNSSTSGNANITGLISNTQYFYQIEATNSAGTSQSVIGSFTTTDDTPLANYLFNNTYANINSQSPFSSTNTTFVNDRNNQPTNAISVGSTSIPIAATIPNIPLGNSIRSVSFWFKKPAHSVAVGLFAYGANANQQTFGLYLGAGGNFVFQTFGNDHDFGGTSNANTWIHAILTYNGASAKLYVNGILIGQSINFTLNTQNTAFKIGGNGAIVEFDDLKIFNYELTQAQVTSLFNNNTLSSSDFNQDNLKVVLYPNPVRDILNIETELEIQSIEIYNIHGQKVLSSNQKQINVSDLAVGMYMVRIQDVANNIAIKKIVIK